MPQNVVGMHSSRPLIVPHSEERRLGLNEGVKSLQRALAKHDTCLCILIHMHKVNISVNNTINHNINIGIGYTLWLDRGNGKEYGNYYSGITYCKSLEGIYSVLRHGHMDLTLMHPKPIQPSTNLG